MSIILRSQTEILSQLETLLADTANDRWTHANIYAAMNMALDQWRGRVQVPMLYTISGGYVGGTHEYSLPDYIDGPITPQQKHYINDWYRFTGLSDDSLIWTDILEYTIEQTASGGRMIRFNYQPYEDAGRVLWWGHQGPVPTALPVTSATIDSDDTSVTLTTKPTIGKAGYIKIDSEWMQYSGVTEAASTLTLTNLLRAQNGTAAASHTGGATVTWGVAMDDPGLLRQLSDQARTHLMEMWLSNPSSRETAHYEKQMVFYQQRADAYWRRYTSGRPTKFNLSWRGVGPLARGSEREMR